MASDSVRRRPRRPSGPISPKIDPNPPHSPPIDDEPSTECDGDLETSSAEDQAQPHHRSSSHKHKHPKAKRRSLTTFIVGGLVGLFFAGWAKNQDLVTMELLQDLRLESIFDAIPAGILKEASDISKREQEVVNYDAFATGLALKSEGLRVKHPVIMVRSRLDELRM